MEYSEFINRVAEHAGFDNVQDAASVSRAVLGTLGELLASTERHHFEAQLPRELKEYVRAWAHTEQARKTLAGLPPDQFVTRVQARSTLNHRDTVKAIAAVMRVLREAVSHGELKDLAEQLDSGFGERLGVSREGG